jgi:hypothetical protein
MKKPLLFTFLLAATVSQAQMTAANEPAIGESETLFVVDSFATNYANVTGTGVTWDYSTIAGYNGTTQDVEVLDPATDTYAADFPGATKLLSVGTINSFFSSTASERTSQGFYYTEATLGDVLVTYETDPATLCTYPFAYGGATVNDAYAGSLDMNFNGFPVNETITGTTNAMIDGEGTLLFTGGNSATNVLRYHSVDSAQTTLPLLGAVDIIKNQYEYFDYASSNLPIFIHITIQLLPSGGGAPITETSLVLSKYDGLNNVSVNDMEAYDFTVAPNPASEFVQVYGDFKAGATAQLTETSGRVIDSFDISNGDKIDVSQLNSGIYLLTINNAGKTLTKTVVVK